MISLRFEKIYFGILPRIKSPTMANTIMNRIFRARHRSETCCRKSNCNRRCRFRIWQRFLRHTSNGTRKTSNSNHYAFRQSLCHKDIGTSKGYPHEVLTAPPKPSTKSPSSQNQQSNNKITLLLHSNLRESAIFNFCKTKLTYS